MAAAKYPDRVGRLVMASTYLRSDAVYPEIREQQAQLGAQAAEFLKDAPMYELYRRVAPRPEDFPRLLDKIGQITAVEVDHSDAVRDLQVPTLVIGADADLAPPSHFVEIFRLHPPQPRPHPTTCHPSPQPTRLHRHPQPHRA